MASTEQINHAKANYSQKKNTKSPGSIVKNLEKKKYVAVVGKSMINIVFEKCLKTGDGI